MLSKKKISIQPHEDFEFHCGLTRSERERFIFNYYGKKIKENKKNKYAILLSMTDALGNFVFECISGKPVIRISK